MIELEGLTKAFGEKMAVDNVSLRVEAGEIFVLLGPNGAGKTTTMKLIAGLLRPTKGAALVGGRSVVGDPLGVKGLLGYVPDEPYLYEKLTAREFFEFTARLHGLGRGAFDRTLDEMVGEFELSPFLDHLCETFSHGMRQRVAIAAALMSGPKAIIIDEPIVGLDPKSIRRLKDSLRRRRDAGAALLLSTHVLPLAEELADRVGIMDNGRLVACGTVAELHSRLGRAASLEELFLRLTGGE